MTPLELLANSDQYNDYKTKTNAAIDILNTFGEGLDGGAAGDVPRKIDGTDFNYEFVKVPTIKAGEAAREKLRIPIGDWNMDTTATISIAHGLNSTQWKTMSIIGGIIRDDADTTYYMLYRPSGGVVQAGVISFDSTNINLGRLTSGDFDGPTFNSTTYNRGFIDIEYTP